MNAFDVTRMAARLDCLTREFRWGRVDQVFLGTGAGYE